MTPQPSVPDWVRSTICVMAAGAVPGMLIVCILGVSPPFGVAGAVGGFAIAATYFAFGKDPPKIPPPE